MSNKLIEQHINLVYFIVNKEYPTYHHDEDIIQSGMLGLCKAAQKFDESKGKFSTYAGRCIRNEINQEFINRKPHRNTVSLETKVGEDLTLSDTVMGDDDVPYLDDDAFYKQLSEEEQNVLRMDGMGYSSDEIAEVTNLSVDKVRKLLRIIRLKWRKFNEN